MRFPRVFGWACVAIELFAAQPSYSETFDLAQAVALARAQNPLLAAAEQRIKEAEGDLTIASVLLIGNPEVEVAAGPRSRRRGVGDGSTDLEIQLTQGFELGGRRGHRIDAASARLEAITKSVDDAHRVVSLAVASAFYETLAARAKVKLEERRTELAEELYVVARKSIARGESAPVEANTAIIRRAEARRLLFSARTSALDAAIRLAELLGLDLANPIDLAGDLDQTPPALDEAGALAQALSSRPDLAAYAHELDAAEADLQLSASRRWPDFAVAFGYTREEADEILLGGIRLSIPAWNRGLGERDRSHAFLERVKAESLAHRRAVESEVRRAFAAVEQARRGLEIYDQELVRAQEESLDLLQRSFRAGEIAYPELIVMQGEVLDGQEGYLDARLTLALGLARLRAAIGTNQTDNLQGEDS